MEFTRLLRAGGRSESVLYQNARYEDLRPVSREYIHRCHLRVGATWLVPGVSCWMPVPGRSNTRNTWHIREGYQYRVCADMSITALKEARKRLTGRAARAVRGVRCCQAAVHSGCLRRVRVACTRIHHLPVDDQATAFGELYRVMAPGQTAVVVNGWSSRR